MLIKKNYSTDDLVLVPHKGNIEVFEISEIVYITCSGDYSKVFLQNKKTIVVRKSLRNWEKILPHNMFIRINRFNIINLKRVKRFEKWFNYSLKIYLEFFEQPLLLSKRYYFILRKRFIS